jgi:hypothetical protein
MKLYPLYPVDHDSDSYRWLIAKHPAPARHDGFNTLFCECAPISEMCIVISDLFVDAEGEVLEGDSLAWALAKFMANPDRLPLYGTMGQWNTMYNHPAYRLYCGKYDDDTKFQEDLAYMSAMIEEGMPEALSAWTDATNGIGYEEAAGVMLTLINAYSV